MRSVFVSGREWFHREGGNTYFSARVWVDGELVAYLPFQYGYGSAYEAEACRTLHTLGLTPDGWDPVRPLWQLRDYGVDVYRAMHPATKRAVTEWGQA